MLDDQEQVERLVQQLLRLEGLDQVPRTGYLQRGVRSPESVSEHSWHVATVAWTLLPHAQPLDSLRVLELALLHDAGELLLGDLPRPAQRLFPDGAKEAAEEQALCEVLEGSGERGRTLAAELRAKQSLEARFVHHCDRLQLLIKTAVYSRRQEGESAAFLAELSSREQDAASDAAQFAVFDALRRVVAETI